MNKIYLEELPKHDNGNVNWKLCINLDIKFEFNNNHGYLTIIKYLNSENKVIFKYLDNEYEIKTDQLKKCNLYFLFDNKFKYDYNIGDIIKDQKRNLTVSNQIRINISSKNLKGYELKCNVCGYISILTENSVNVKKTGCACCSGQKIVKGINDFNTKHPELARYLENYEDGYIITTNSKTKIKLKCPNCGAINNINCGNYVKTGKFNCPKCDDGISYPNKFIFNVLQQLNIEFEIEKVFDWLKSKRYDFYIPNLNCIIEVNGKQHYSNSCSFPIKLDEQIEIDNLKQNLALDNNIENYIVIDCSISNPEFIKNNILSSKLNDLFDLSTIDWKLCDEFSNKSLMKKICEYKRDNPNATTGLISKIFKLSTTTIKLYLNNGTKIWDWLKYNPEQERIDCILRKEKKIEVFKNNISVGVFDSAVKLQNIAVEKFGVKLNKSSVGKAIRFDKSHNGFTFKYV